MKLISNRSGKFVVPGSKIGVIEEVLPGQGTYVENGKILSSITGNILIDLLSRKVTVLSKVRKPIVPRIGSIATGVVMNVQKNANIRMFEIDGKSISGFFSGLLHISNVSNRFVKTMYDAFKPGDVIRAKVISTTNQVFHLSTDDPKLGVLYALCSNCGAPLIKNGYVLHCPSCKRRKSRKTASDFIGQTTR
ncbi:exosome complex RNA-binding protein Csl4 [Candidatus Bathyarchaeota archaeon]|nr:exosome complex RNA-binding protein Csl4 [Candidatus Bathyarchaeota archaeon]